MFTVVTTKTDDRPLYVDLLCNHHSGQLSLLTSAGQDIITVAEAAVKVFCGRGGNLRSHSPCVTEQGGTSIYGLTGVMKGDA